MSPVLGFAFLIIGLGVFLLFSQLKWKKPETYYLKCISYYGTEEIHSIHLKPKMVWSNSLPFKNQRPLIYYSKESRNQDSFEIQRWRTILFWITNFLTTHMRLSNLKKKLWDTSLKLLLLNFKVKVVLRNI